MAFTPLDLNDTDPGTPIPEPWYAWVILKSLENCAYLRAWMDGEDDTMIDLEYTCDAPSAVDRLERDARDADAEADHAREVACKLQLVADRAAREAEVSGTPGAMRLALAQASEAVRATAESLARECKARACWKAAYVAVRR